MKNLGALVVVAVLLSATMMGQAATSTTVESAQWHALGPASAVRNLPNGVEIRAGEAILRLSALSDTVLRVQIAPDGRFLPEDSFAVLPEAVQSMKLSVPAKVQETADAVIMTTAALEARVERSGLGLSISDLNGHIISQDDPARPMLWKQTPVYSEALQNSFTEPALDVDKVARPFKIWKVMPEDEHYFGLGDKAGPLDHRDQAFSMWNTDHFGWQESSDPLYKSIPFFLALRQGRSYGIFLDNTYRSSFDFGKEFREAYSFGSEDGPIDYYFIYGPHPKQVIEQYTQLTGRTPLPAMWTLGYQQCRYSYFPEAKVREIADTFLKKQIPVDAIYLDIDYQVENRPFTVDPKKFPHFRQMIADLASEGIKTILITDLHIPQLPGYAPYDTGMAGDHFVKNPDGSVYVGTVWPGPSVFPDFTAGAKTREWWGSLYKDFVADGVRGFWNDMNEPSVLKRSDKTMPLDTVHRVGMPDGTVRKTDHREIHNVYGFQNARSTFEGLRRLNPNERPFVLTRAAYAGAQRYAATWTGDNSSSWNHMRLSIPTLLNMGISGYAYVGDDIGGFWGDSDPVLLTRWMELGAFNPLYRNHSTKGSANQEPWVHGPEHEAIRKKYIELRYRLMPYLYSAFEESSRNGIPVMRPLFLEYPNDPTLATTDSAFLFGRDILVAPQIWQFLPEYQVPIPRGEWYDYWTGKQVKGGEELALKPALDELPLFVRAGAFIPEQPVVENLDQIPQGPLQVRLYTPSPSSTQECDGLLYIDDGHTYAYAKGEHWHVSYSCNVSSADVTIHTGVHGHFQPWWTSIQFQVFGLQADPAQVTLAGRKLPHSYDPATQSATFVVPLQDQQQEIRVIF